MNRIRLSARPPAQRFIGWVGLNPNYRLARTRIRLEGLAKVPGRPVIFAMNHTDRYNYWPFQYRLWREANRFTATWVKGKYYESPWLARFMEWTNNIPTVSRGYLITRDLMGTLGRRPADDEYKLLRARIEACARGEQPLGDVPGALEPLFSRPRDLFGRPFDPATETYEDALNSVFDTMMRRFVALNRRAVALGLDLLIFPQGTRSKRLTRGHIGMAQMALALGSTIVPVGCSGSDRVYPGGSPFAKGGDIVYRIGDPISSEDVRPFLPDTPFEPFTPSAEVTHRDRFQGLTDLVMDRINELVDPDYQFAGPDDEGATITGSQRFV